MITMTNSEECDELENSQAHSNRKRFTFGFFSVTIRWANLLFAFMAVTGQVGQGVSIILWLSAATKHNTTSTPTRDKPEMDAYFVLSFPCLFFVVLFGLTIIFTRLLYPHSFGETERSFPHKIIFAVGLCDGLGGALITFASPPNRTAPYLQAILGNFMIPLTILTRLILLRRKPTKRKLICGMVVLLSLLVCLLPTIFPKQIDPNKPKEKGEGASGVAGILWPFGLIIGLVPTAIMFVVEEKGLKMQNMMSRRGVNLVYFLFWESFYQLLSVMALFWVDIIPGYGFADSISQFGQNWWFSCRCFFGGAGCDGSAGLRGAISVLMFMLTDIGGGLLIRYSEGATLLAIANSLVTPLGFLFWTLWKPEPFEFQPEAHPSTYFSIGALVFMIPAIYLYNTGSPEIDLDKQRSHQVNNPPSEDDFLIKKT